MSTEQFHPEKLLTGGPAAKVYRGVETATGRKVLLKALLHEHESPHALDREKLLTLASSLMHVRHPQIAGLITMLPAEDEFALIYDFMPGMNVRAFAAEHKASPADIRAVAVQLMHALMAGEQLRQPHGDPKPSNLIIASHPGGGLFVQVQDWGLTLARSVQSPETLWFRAPELHAGDLPTSQSDLFTAAASLFCLATNSAPAQGDDPADLVQQWRAFDTGHALRHLRPDFGASFIDWLTWLSRPDPRQRPHSVAQALEMLMPSMHTGFIPMQPPQMPIGAQTGPLVSNAHPNAPKPKPIASKSSTPATTATQTAAAPAPPEKKSSGTATFIAVVLNFAALVLVGFFAWPVIREHMSGWKFQLPSIGISSAAVAETPKSKIATPSPASLSKSSPAPAKPATAPTVVGSGVNGRYVRIEIPKKSILNLAEVQVFSSGENIAPKGKATQSSVSQDGDPELAIDGNTDGDKVRNKSVSHTNGNARGTPWWQVDLGSESPVQTVVLWNRTDKDYGERTTNLTVKVLDAKNKVVWEKKGLPKPDPTLELAIGD